MRFQANVANFVVETIGSPFGGTLFLCFIIFILGMFLDPTVLIAMLAPTILSIGNIFGFDPIFYGVVMTIMMQVGAITPPVGSFLFVACGVGDLPIQKAVKPLIPFIITVLLLARVMNRLLENHYAIVTKLILGFVVSSIIMILPTEFTGAVDVLISLVAFVVGFWFAHWMDNLKLESVVENE